MQGRCRRWEHHVLTLLVKESGCSWASELGTAPLSLSLAAATEPAPGQPCRQASTHALLSVCLCCRYWHLPVYFVPTCILAGAAEQGPADEGAAEVAAEDGVAGAAITAAAGLAGVEPGAQQQGGQQKKES